MIFLDLNNYNFKIKKLINYSLYATHDTLKFKTLNNKIVYS